MDLMRYEDYPGKRDNGEQGGNEYAGASPPQHRDVLHEHHSSE